MTKIKIPEKYKKSHSCAYSQLKIISLSTEKEKIFQYSDLFRGHNT